MPEFNNSPINNPTVPNTPVGTPPSNQPVVTPVTPIKPPEIIMPQQVATPTSPNVPSTTVGPTPAAANNVSSSTTTNIGPTIKPIAQQNMPTDPQPPSQKSNNYLFFLVVTVAGIVLCLIIFWVINQINPMGSTTVATPLPTPVPTVEPTATPMMVEEELFFNEATVGATATTSATTANLTYDEIKALTPFNQLTIGEVIETDASDPDLTGCNYTIPLDNENFYLQVASTPNCSTSQPMKATLMTTTGLGVIVANNLPSYTTCGQPVVYTTANNSVYIIESVCATDTAQATHQWCLIDVASQRAIAQRTQVEANRQIIEDSITTFGTQTSCNYTN